MQRTPHSTRSHSLTPCSLLWTLPGRRPSLKMRAPTVKMITAPKSNTVSAKLGIDAGVRHAAVAGADVGAKEAVAGATEAFPAMVGVAAIEFKAGAKEGAKEGVERFEPIISLFGGSFFFTAAFFVPPTGELGVRQVVVGMLGAGFFCYGVIGKHALRTKDAAKDAAEADAAKAADAAAKLEAERKEAREAAARLTQALVKA